MNKTPRYMTEKYISLDQLSQMEADGRLSANADLFLNLTDGEAVTPVESIYMASIYTLTPWQERGGPIEVNALCLVGRDIDMAEGFDYHTFEPIAYSKIGFILEDFLAIAYNNKDILSPNSAILYATNSLRVKTMSRAAGSRDMIIVS